MKAMNDVFNRYPIMSCYRGSRAHNLYIPPESDEEFGTDDLDLIEVFSYGKSYYYSLYGYNKNKDVDETMEDNLDIVAYELMKMFDMLVKLNPNVFPTLYTRDEDYLQMSEAWKYVRENKQLFDSKNLIYHTSKGFAVSQRKRMENGAYNGYMGKKRKLLVDKYGYDLKNAVHTIRILRMGIEHLTEGAPVVYRENDRDFLLSIKRGEFTHEQILNIIDDHFKSLDESFLDSKLPESSNPRKINELIYNVMEMVLD